MRCMLMRFALDECKSQCDKPHYWASVSPLKYLGLSSHPMRFALGSSRGLLIVYLLKKCRHNKRKPY